MIAWFATKGTGSNDALRIESLLSRIPLKQEWRFDKGNKAGSFIGLLRRIYRERPQLLIMEGTGIAGGLACLLGRLVWKVPYVFSSGDAVGPFVAAHAPWAGPLFHFYERLLCRFAAGFIGWTPYLCGRAMTFGCMRAVTAAGWPLGDPGHADPAACRRDYRARWNIPENALIIGLVGALEWNSHHQYCYGLELVRAVRRVRREDVYAVIIGGGSGLERLKELAQGDPRIRLPGPVPLDEVVACMHAMDIGSLPQSTDAVGSFRFTTKLSEYAAAGLPVVTSQIPAAYDLGVGWMWRLPGRSPWDGSYVNRLAELLETLTLEELSAKANDTPSQMPVFDRDDQIRRVTLFIEDLLA